MPDAKNPSYCSNFYKGLYIQKTNADSVVVSACCVNTPSTDSYTTIDFQNNAYLQSQRTNTRSAACAECWRQEDSGQTSYRQQANQWHSETFPDSDSETVELIKMDYNLDPVCNAKCIICTGWFSSLWAQEDREFGQTWPIRSFTEVKNNDLVQNLDLSRLRRIYFNGGEPLLSSEMLTIMQKIRRDQGSLMDLHCQLSTNGSITPSDSLIDLWQQCRRVDIWVSLDAVGQQFEYIRNPLQFEKVWDNCLYMGHLGNHINVGFSFTIGVHNFDHYATAVDWLQKHRGDINGGDWGINHCNGDLAVDKASQHLLKSWKQKYQPDGPPWHQDLYRQIANLQGQPDDSAWQRHLAMIDQRRGLDWRKSLPELAQQEKIALDLQ